MIRRAFQIILGELVYNFLVKSPTFRSFAQKTHHFVQRPDGWRNLHSSYMSSSKTRSSKSISACIKEEIKDFWFPHKVKRR